MSPLGSVDKQLIGCRQVAYFEPLNMIVLNTTVIFDAHQKQKNLDPLQKCTSDYIHEKYPDATRLAVVTSPELSVANWNNYTKNGFPWNNGDGTYRYLKMIKTLMTNRTKAGSTMLDRTTRGSSGLTANSATSRGGTHWFRAATVSDGPTLPTTAGPHSSSQPRTDWTRSLMPM
eukprot:COSAG06_NODE_947_length_11359_cov_13.054707_1_plen_174_part_00